jgi:hypothetical protein
VGVAVHETGSDQRPGKVKYRGARGNPSGKSLGMPYLPDTPILPPDGGPPGPGVKSQETRSAEKSGGGECCHAEE